MEESHKIHAPLVLQHILMLVPFPSELGKLRLVSKTWNEAALKGLGAQIMSIDAQIETLTKEMNALSGTPHFTKLITEFKAFKARKPTVIKKFDIIQLVAYKFPPPMNIESVTLACYVLTNKFATWSEAKPILKSNDFVSNLRARELSKEQYLKIKEFIKAKNLIKSKIKPCSMIAAEIFGIIEDKLKEYQYKELKLVQLTELDRKIKHLKKKRDTAIALIQKNK